MRHIRVYNKICNRSSLLRHAILVYIQQNQSPQDRSGYVWGRHERSKKSPQSRTSLLLHLLFALPAITVAARLGGQMSTIIRLIVRTVRHCAGVKNSLKWPPPTNRCGVDILRADILKCNVISVQKAAARAYAYVITCGPLKNITLSLLC